MIWRVGIFTLIASALLSWLYAAEQSKPSSLVKEVLEAKSWQEHHLLISRQAEKVNGLVDLIRAYEGERAKHPDDPLLLLGYAEAIDRGFWLRRNSSAQLGDRGDRFDIRLSELALHEVTTKHPEEVYGWVRLYFHVLLYGEKGLPRPSPIVTQWATIRTPDGKVSKIPVVRDAPNPAKEKRLAEIFAKMMVADPEDSGVLLIRASRAKSPEEAFRLAVRSYQNGGERISKLETLYQIWFSARRAGKGAEVAKYEKALRDHLAAHANSVWSGAFLSAHPDFKASTG